MLTSVYNNYVLGPEYLPDYRLLLYGGSTQPILEIRITWTLALTHASRDLIIGSLGGLGP